MPILHLGAFPPCVANIRGAEGGGGIHSLKKADRVGQASAKAKIEADFQAKATDAEAKDGGTTRGITEQAFVDSQAGVGDTAKAELERPLARKAFKAFDQDHDGVLNHDEHARLVADSTRAGHEVKLADASGHETKLSDQERHALLAGKNRVVERDQGDGGPVRTQQAKFNEWVNSDQGKTFFASDAGKQLLQDPAAAKIFQRQPPGIAEDGLKGPETLWAVQARLAAGEPEQQAENAVGKLAPQSEADKAEGFEDPQLKVEKPTKPLPTAKPTTSREQEALDAAARDQAPIPHVGGTLTPDVTAHAYRQDIATMEQAKGALADVKQLHGEHRATDAQLAEAQQGYDGLRNDFAGKYNAYMHSLVSDHPDAGSLVDDQTHRLMHDTNRKMLEQYVQYMPDNQNRQTMVKLYAGYSAAVNAAES